MHTALALMRDNGNAATEQWAAYSLMDDTADSNGTLPPPTIYSMRAGVGGGGGGGCGRVICPQPMRTLVFF